MANRRAIQADVDLYGDQGVVIDDAILDTPTNTSPANYIFYGAIGTDPIFSNLRVDPTIWLDSGGFNSNLIRALTLSNVTNGVNTPLSGKVTIKPLITDNNPVVIDTIPGLSGDVVTINHIEEVVIDGRGKGYDGIMWGVNGFDHENFGIRIIADSDPSNTTKMMLRTEAYASSPVDVTIRSVNIEGGFSRIRAWSQAIDASNKLLVEWCLLGKGSSEPIYVNRTDNDGVKPRAEVTVRNNVILLSGAEALQNMHMINNSNVYNNVIVVAAMKKHDMFDPFQSNGIQQIALEDHVLRNNIVVGWNESGIVYFGNGTTNNTGIVPGTATIANNWMGEGCARLGLFQNVDDGMKYEFLNNTIGRMLNRFDDLPYVSPVNTLLGTNGTNSDTINAVGNIFPSTAPNDPANEINKALNFTDDSILLPAFNKTGLEGYSIADITYYSHPFGRNPAANTAIISATASSDGGATTTFTSAAHGLSNGEWVFLYGFAGSSYYYGGYTVTVIDTDNFKVNAAYQAGATTGAWQATIARTYTANTSIVFDPTDGNLYKCILNFTPVDETEPFPSSNPTYFELITWDGNKVRYDQVGYDPGAGVYNRMPADINLDPTSIEAKKDRGFPNTGDEANEIVVKVLIADDANGTNAKVLPKFNDTKFDIDEWPQAEVGKYYAFSIKEPNKDPFITPYAII